MIYTVLCCTSLVMSLVLATAHVPQLAFISHAYGFHNDAAIPKIAYVSRCPLVPESCILKIKVNTVYSLKKGKQKKYVCVVCVLCTALHKYAGKHMAYSWGCVQSSH